MIQLTPQSRILLAVEPIDFRKGIDGIASICANEFKKDLSSGTLKYKKNKALFEPTGFPWFLSVL